MEGEKMKATRLPEKPDAKSPAGAEIFYLMDGGRRTVGRKDSQ
jgi:hypothetical protein